MQETFTLFLQLGKLFFPEFCRYPSHIQVYRQSAASLKTGLPHSCDCTVTGYKISLWSIKVFQEIPGSAIFFCKQTASGASGCFTDQEVLPWNRDGGGMILNKFQISQFHSLTKNGCCHAAVIFYCPGGMARKQAAHSAAGQQYRTIQAQCCPGITVLYEASQTPFLLKDQFPEPMVVHPCHQSRCLLPSYCVCQSRQNGFTGTVSGIYCAWPGMTSQFSQSKALFRHLKRCSQIHESADNFRSPSHQISDCIWI